MGLGAWCLGTKNDVAFGTLVLELVNWGRKNDGVFSRAVNICVFVIFFFLVKKMGILKLGFGFGWCCVFFEGRLPVACLCPVCFRTKKWRLWGEMRSMYCAE